MPAIAVIAADHQHFMPKALQTNAQSVDMGHHTADVGQISFGKKGYSH